MEQGPFITAAGTTGGKTYKKSGVSEKGGLTNHTIVKVGRDL